MFRIWQSMRNREAEQSKAGRTDAHEQRFDRLAATYGKVGQAGGDELGAREIGRHITHVARLLRVTPNSDHDHERRPYERTDRQ